MNIWRDLNEALLFVVEKHHLIEMGYENIIMWCKIIQLLKT